MNGKAMIAIVAVAIIAIAGAVYFMNSDNGGSIIGKNTGGVSITVSNMYTSDIPVKIYVDGELVQDTVAGKMSFASANKKVSWSGGDTHNITVKVTYKVNGQNKEISRNVTLTKNQNQIVQISL